MGSVSVHLPRRVIRLSNSTFSFSAMRLEEYRRLRQLFFLLSDGIIVMDPQRRIVFVNPAAIRLTGWLLGDVVPYCLYCQTRKVETGSERCLLAADPKRHYFESEMPTKMGRPVPVGMSRTFLTADEGNFRRDMVITVRDVTVERQEEELAVSRRLTHHTLNVQEDERKRLSQELHDGISQTLYGISLGMEHLQRHIKDASLTDKLNQLQERLRSCMQEVRVLSRSLYPAVLHDIGLLAAIRSLRDELTTDHCAVQFLTDLEEDDEMTASVAVQVYRIVQEGIRNALQHSQARYVSILLFQSDDHENVLLQIEDDGVGFVLPDKDREHMGYGLRNMQERARAIAGTFDIETSPSQGTKIRIQFPRSGTRE
ncbi:histidine kinase [Sulfoacidibacillus ferrooxidans]|uniref:PAS domain-containing sensor histidine kinase n=1 Tax=Sulfoacidibacillus ferrooxidans TaxID=2005001 RepID=UPI001F50939F|nr:histidine kinase [Sulfoacidibacillus ferrooxidans]